MSDDTGLSRFGEQCIYEMNRVGMLIGLSHAGRRTSLDAIAASADPIIFSHSPCYDVAKHTRNANDEQIKALAAKGGVIGLCPHSVMCNEDQSSWPTVDRFIDHIEHVADLVGIDYVGIGTDRWKRPTLDYLMGRVELQSSAASASSAAIKSTCRVSTISTSGTTWWITYWPGALARRTSKRVLGGNLLRVFRKVWDKE